MKSALARLRATEPSLFACAAIAVGIALAMFLLQGHVGINLQDEAFLWYGAIRTHAGELPLRDFRSYDPGRYFWCASGMTMLGDGLVAVRAANWAFAALGLCAGLLIASRSHRSIPWLVTCGLVLVPWIHPPWKLYESSVAMLVAFIAVRLMESPSSARRFAAGAVVGLAAFFGRNMGVYAGLAMLVLVSVQVWKQRQPVLRSLGDLALGTLVGYAPMIGLVLLADGFREAFVESIAFYTRQSALNAERAFPFPWRIDFSRRDAWSAAVAFVIGSLFLALPIAYAAGFLRGMSARASTFARWSTVFALSCVGGVWFHHASVRSDTPHLAQSIHPFLLLVLSLPAALPERVRLRGRIAALLFLTGVTVLGIGNALPVVRRALATDVVPYERLVLRGDELVLAPNDARLVRSLMAGITTNVLPEEALWVSAHFLGLYPILDRRAPTWDIYPAWQADDVEQERMLRELRDVRWAVLDTRPIGGDARMRLENSHPRVWRWVMESFERQPLPGVPDSVLLLRRKDASAEQRPSGDRQER